MDFIIIVVGDDGCFSLIQKRNGNKIRKIFFPLILIVTTVSLPQINHSFWILAGLHWYSNKLVIVKTKAILLVCRDFVLLNYV